MTNNCISWDSYFINICLLSALRSKDPYKKVGCVLVNSEKRIVGVGYNGMPQGRDDLFTWNKNGKLSSETKYPYVVHAEMNCLLNTTINDLSNCILYTSKFCCPECLKHIIQKGIKYIMYLEDPTDINSEDTKASLTMIQKLKIQVQKYSGPILIKI
jgi:dCMP deaminase